MKEKRRISTILVGLVCFCIGVSIPVFINKQGFLGNSEKNKFDRIYSVLKNDWYFSDQVEDLDEELMEQAIEGMTQLEIDPHTNYFDLQMAQDFASDLEGSNVGLGFLYTKDHDGNFFIREVYMNSGAYQAGLEAGDIITKIDEKTCSETDAEDIVSYIQSKEGKQLDIVYKRGEKEYTTHAMPSVYDTSVSLRLFKDYAYISVNSFSEQTGTEFADAMQEVKEQGLKSIILDLRGNAGGYLYSTLEVASSLLPKDSVVFIEKNKEGKEIEKKTVSDFDQVKLDQIVILQNGNTASASEALIGALRTHLKSKVTTVGTTTCGKGTEQTQMPFKDGTSLKYTVAQWLTPDKKSINEKGFKPDVKVKPETFRSTSYQEMDKDEVIKKDSVHENAKALQVYLDYLGYPVSRQDEYFSIESSQSLAKFQKSHDLAASGDCDMKTWQALSEEVVLKMSKDGLAKDKQMKKAVEQIK